MKELYKLKLQEDSNKTSYKYCHIIADSFHDAIKIYTSKRFSKRFEIIAIEKLTKTSSCSVVGSLLYQENK